MLLAPSALELRAVLGDVAVASISDADSDADSDANSEAGEDVGIL